MSIAQVKNLQRRLDNLCREAETELTRTCGHELWRTLGLMPSMALMTVTAGPAPIITTVNG